MNSREINWVKSIALIGEDIFFIPGGECSTIFKINMNKWILNKELQMNYKGINEWTICGVSNNICCIPHKGIRCVIYKPDAKESIYFESDDDEIELVKAIYYAQKIWFIPRNLPYRMLRFSFVDYSFSEDLKWSKELERLNVNGRISRFFIDGEMIYLIIFDEWRILQYNLSGHQMKDIEIPIRAYFTDIIFSDNKFYLLVENNRKKLYCWNLENNNICELSGTGEGCYQKLIPAGNVLLLDTGVGLEILKDCKIIKTRVVYPDRLNRANFISAVKCNSKWIVLPWERANFIEFSEDFKDYFIYKLRVSIKDFFSDCTIPLYESAFLLKDYIEGIIKFNKAYGKIQIEKSYGEKIYCRL